MTNTPEDSTSEDSTAGGHWHEAEAARQTAEETLVRVLRERAEDLVDARALIEPLGLRGSDLRVYHQRYRVFHLQDQTAAIVRVLGSVRRRAPPATTASPCIVKSMDLRCSYVGFEVVGDITAVEVIAVGRGIRQLGTIRKRYGKGRWRKLKGTAQVKLADGTLRRAELH